MTTPQHDINSPENIARRKHGQDVLSRIDGHQGEAVIDSLADINPALGHHVAGQHTREMLTVIDVFGNFLPHNQYLSASIASS